MRALDFGIRPFEEVAPVGKLGQAVRSREFLQNPVGLAQFAVGAIERLGPLGDAPFELAVQFFERALGDEKSRQVARGAADVRDLTQRIRHRHEQRLEQALAALENELLAKLDRLRRVPALEVAGEQFVAFRTVAEDRT